jgi:hypothetical protein
VDPVPDPLLLRKTGSAGNRTRSSGSVASNSDHKATEAVYKEISSLNIQQKGNEIISNYQINAGFWVHTVTHFGTAVNTRVCLRAHSISL